MTKCIKCGYHKFIVKTVCKDGTVEVTCDKCGHDQFVAGGY